MSGTSLASRNAMFEQFSAHDAVRVPGLLSLSRIGLAAVFPLLLGRPGYALTVLGIAGATDLLDGWYARRFHQASPTGAMLDGLTDKIFVLTVAVALVASGSLTAVDVALLGTRDIGELLLAARMRVAGRRVLGRSANLGGKITTLLQYAAVALVILRSPHRDIFIDASAIAGVIATAAYWRRDVRA